jgi:chromosome segregation ATPase
MKLPFITREAHEREMNAAQTENWDLRRTVKTLRERERARMICCAVIEQDAEEARRAREAAEQETTELRERVRLLREDNRELRARYDATRMELTRANNEVRKLRLMRTALEARVAAKCEVEGGK